jgi:hypothetical protein
MSKQSLIITISVILIAVFGVVVFMTRSNEPTQTYEQSPTSTNEQTDSGIVRTINGLHQYQPDESRHIVAGTTTVPTPCHELSTDTEIRESDPEQVTLNFSASKQNPNEMCAQQIQEVRFQVMFNASANASIVGGEYDGDEVRLNLREVGPDENLEDFQVYTKG